MNTMKINYVKPIKLPEEDTVFECKSIDDMNNKMFWWGFMNESCYMWGACDGEYYRDCKKNGFKYKFVVRAKNIS